MKLTRSLAYRRMTSRMAAALHRNDTEPADSAIVEAEFVFDDDPFGMAHASTIEQVGGTLIAAWFAGSLEGRADVGIWVSRNRKGRWSAPVRVATGEEAGGARHPCWNPVLFQPARGPLMLFYKVGASPRSWWGMLRTSNDGGQTWSAAERLPDPILGPIKNKPIELTDGTLLSPSSTEEGRWRVYIERSIDGANWERIGPVADGGRLVAIQPSILRYRDARLQLLCRTKQGWIAQSWSGDRGRTWSTLEPIELPNPNSGTDAVTLDDGRQLLVYNHSHRTRTNLGVALSTDGRTWSRVLGLDHGLGEYSYPAVIQTTDGLVHVTYSWNLRRIRHVVLDPERL